MNSNHHFMGLLVSGSCKPFLLKDEILYTNLLQALHVKNAKILLIFFSLLELFFVRINVNIRNSINGILNI